MSKVRTESVELSSSQIKMLQVSAAVMLLLVLFVLSMVQTFRTPGVAATSAPPVASENIE